MWEHGDKDEGAPHFHHLFDGNIAVIVHARCELEDGTGHMKHGRGFGHGFARLA
jgi:hypothetical protein